MNKAAKVWWGTFLITTATLAGLIVGTCGAGWAVITGDDEDDLEEDIEGWR